MLVRRLGVDNQHTQSELCRTFHEAGDFVPEGDSEVNEAASDRSGGRRVRHIVLRHDHRLETRAKPINSRISQVT